MEINRYVLEKPILAGNVEIIPVTQIRAVVKKPGKSIMALGSKTVMGIVIKYPEKICTYRATGEEIPLEKFIEQVPDIEALLGIGD